ncbi:uncharacterized protein N7483_007671 [Penicillium malachiteum]|uniref:uncharacterized protein n=1 Tax=Penicillium malachiteum TaxID=1324776 RepID=UPI00254856C3|nr:uncharacterized protein N7483_007671 [Penicillium malachiteum]KAJ5726314.1 hypothetical protein N7483_007671 [Penicillium malachiteum]
MSQSHMATPRGAADPSVPEAEKRASSLSQDKAHTATPRPPKPRSCVICRSRKVRCDKLSPCSNCRRANIACIYPSGDRPPRWARRLERAERPVTGEVMDRLHHLESLVKELTEQLEQAYAAAKSPAASSNSPENSSHSRDPSYQENSGTGSSDNVHDKFGRLVLNDAKKSCYVGSAFWSWVNDELDDLKMETSNIAAANDESSDDELSYKTPSTQELGRTPSDRHIPFLINVFSENVNIIAQTVHIPTIDKMMRDLRGDLSKLTPANEALMFSIYYAAVTSMEEDDVMINFGVAKTDLNLKYRLGLEHALANADFLNTPDLALVQSLAIFLLLARRHDSPRYVWMMTGIAIRMAIALGLQRDGSHFGYLTPFEIEMRRRVWWSLIALDVRTSEDQGSDFTIILGSFDTKMPLNINNEDISPDSTETPVERDGLTDMSFPRVNLAISDLSKKMMARVSKTTTMEEQSGFLDEMYQRLQDGFLQFSESEPNILHWVSTAVTRLVMAKMTLITFSPVLFSSATERISEEMRNKLLVAAIEIAEYNHALNSEEGCRQWRWAFQTYTHWYAIVYLLIEITRRPFSPIVERAWVALHSIWLIPTQSHMNKNLRVWIPLRKLRLKAQQHRESEILRLRADADAVAELEKQHNAIPEPSSPGSFQTQQSAAIVFLERWRRLISMPRDVSRHDADGHISHTGGALHYATDAGSEAPFVLINNPVAGSYSVPHQPALEQNPADEHHMTQQTTTPAQSDTDLHQSDMDFQSNIIPWLWSDDTFQNPLMDPIDIDMELDSGDVDWNTWVASAQGMSFNQGPD